MGNPRAVVVKSRITNHESRITRVRRQAGKVWRIGAGRGRRRAAHAQGRARAFRSKCGSRDPCRPAVLTHLRTGARIVEVGERGGAIPRLRRSSRTHGTVARRGATVARLEGRRPVRVRARGEGMAVLRAAVAWKRRHCRYHCGPGAPAALGIPVTHRDTARGVTLLTDPRANGRGRLARASREPQHAGHLHGHGAARGAGRGHACRGLSRGYAGVRDPERDAAGATGGRRTARRAPRAVAAAGLASPATS